MASRGLGVLTLDLVAKIGGFTGPLDQAGRHLDKRSREMQKSMQQFGREFAAASKILFGLGAAGVGLYIRNTIEAEKVTAQLQSRLKDTAGIAGRSLADLTAQADKLQALTVFDDESIGMAQAALLTFTDIRDLNFDRTIEAATDLATVMGTDVADAAKVLGKALSDPEKGFGALKKAGVVLAEDQIALVKRFMDTGMIAEAQGVILDALAGKMGTAAEAARDTLGGSLKGLQNAFNNLLEGDGSSAGVKDAQHAIEEFSKSLNSSEAHSNMDAFIGGLVSAVRWAGDVADGFVKAAQQVGNTFGFLSNVAGDFVAMNKAFYSGDLEGALAARRKLLGEYQNFNEETKRTRGDFDKRAGVSTPGKLAGPRNTFPLNGSETIHGGPDFGKGARSTSGRSGDNAAARAKAEADRRLEEQARKLVEAHNSLTSVLQAQAQEMGGPSLDAAIDYRDALVKIQEVETELGKQGKLDADAQAQIGLARDQAAEGYRKQLEAIESVKTPLQLLIEQQEHELETLGLTGAALLTANQLYGQSAEQIAKFGAAVKSNNELIERNREAIDASNQFRESFEDNAFAVIRESKSIEDAFKSLADTFIDQLVRMELKKLSSALFDSGTTGGGSSGSWITALASMFMGGTPASGGGGFGIPMPGSGPLPGFAMGTNFAPGGLAVVGERGPEIVNLPRGAEVVPNHRMSQGSGFTQNLNFQLAAPTEMRTQQQIAAKAAYEGKRAAARGY